LETSTYGALLKLQAEAEGVNLPLSSPFGTRSRRTLLSFADMLGALIAEREKLTLPELFDLTMAHSGYRDFVRDGTRQGNERWENLLELRGVAQGYASVDPSEALSLFLEDVALVSDVDALTEDERGPALLTLHAAKGLEFPIVFIVGLDEGLFPHNRSMDDIDAMEEERRLCYVGVTRAMDRLYLLHTFRRTMFGTNELSVPSRFLVDVPSDLVKSQTPPSSKGITTRQAAAFGTQPAHSVGRRSSANRPLHRETADASYSTSPQFHVGDTVVHGKFGEGVVIKSHIADGDQEVEVAFPDQGIKRLSVSFAPLKKKE
jgi:DNA helicase-2/ATP-dependent DNA helicase PcrA